VGSEPDPRVVDIANMLLKYALEKRRTEEDVLASLAAIYAMAPPGERHWLLEKVILAILAGVETPAGRYLVPFFGTQTCYRRGKDSVFFLGVLRHWLVRSQFSEFHTMIDGLLRVAERDGAK
jgi:hypothetical protein